MVEFLANECGRPSLVFADCLSSQWTSSVLMRAWLENLIWAPYAPEVTSWFQEPDTHEHSQLKALIREVKAELHFALEHEYRLHELCKVWFIHSLENPFPPYPRVGLRE